MDLYAAYQTAMASGDFEAVTYGSFSPTVGVGGLAQLCVASSCASAASSQGSFSLAGTVFKILCNRRVLVGYHALHKYATSLPVGSCLFQLPISTSAFYPANPWSDRRRSLRWFLVDRAWLLGSRVYGASCTISAQLGAIRLCETNAPTSLGGTSVTIGGQAAFASRLRQPESGERPSPSGVVTRIPRPRRKYILRFQHGLQGEFDGDSARAASPRHLRDQRKTVCVCGIGPGCVLYSSARLLGGRLEQSRQTGNTIILYGSASGPVTPNIPAGRVAGPSQHRGKPQYLVRRCSGNCCICRIIARFRRTLSVQRSCAQHPCERQNTRDLQPSRHSQHANPVPLGR